MTADAASLGPGLSCEQMGLLLEDLHEAAWIVDCEGRITHCNRLADRLCGYRSDELRTFNLRHLLASEPNGGLEAVLIKVESGKHPIDCPVELLARNGARVPVELSFSLLGTTDRKRPLALCVAKQAQAGVDPRFKMLAVNTREMLLVYDLDGRLIYANPATLRLTGYSQAELEEARFICWVHQDDCSRMLAHWDGLFRGDGFEEEEYRLVTKDGRLKWMSASWGPLLDESGTQVGVQGRERDVTARKLAELAQKDSELHLRKAEQHFHTLFEDSPVPMWEEDFSRVKELLDEHAALAQGNWTAFLEGRPELVEECVRRVRVLNVNRSAREFYGASSREQLVAGLADLFDQSAYEVFRRELAVLAGGEHLFQAVLDVRDLSGSLHTVRMFVSLEPALAGDWSRVIVAFLDMTEANQLHEEYLQSQKMESLGRFAGAVAHDINNLLTVVNGYCDLLQTRLLEGDPSHSWVHEIRKAGQTGAELMNQLLTFSRRQPVQAGPMSLNSLVRESAPMIRRLVGEDVSVVTLLDPAAGDVNADAALMRQLLLNLVANAREAMPRGGKLTMETRLVGLGPHHEEEPPSSTGRLAVLLRVSDTGIGMDESVRQRLFEPFFTTKRHRLGSGLGLASAFGIVNQQGGHIQVASEPGKGSSFSIYLDQLPAAHELPQGPAGPALLFGNSAGLGTALVTEDQPEVRALAGAILQRMGFEVLEAADGKEALAVAQNHPGPIQLLLTDVVMPEMNGLALADSLTAIRPDLKVVFMSGYADRDLDGSDRLANSSAFLPKPFTPDSLAGLIRRILAGSPSTT